MTEDAKPPSKRMKKAVEKFQSDKEVSMTVHASEVAQIVKAALDEDSQVGEVELVAHTPNPDAYYANRDGRYEYVCAGRDCVRGFRVTVEAIPFEDVDRLAHPEQYEAAS